MIDAHTKWAEVFPVSSTKSSSTIKCFRETFSRLGIPNIIASDNGSTFTSNEFKDFTKRNGIKLITTAPFHPATNGLAERFVKSFKIAMKAAKNDSGTISQKISSFFSLTEMLHNPKLMRVQHSLCSEEDYNLVWIYLGQTWTFRID
ncbi:hypothetical protein Bpfe_000286 [Biomphalaria pfeifferi]|uniref:Integrase catalytic domain-containing protein n=1 Tax=Biomphalaria pfeifferi TaxID=112525 RepID=A0AAD8CCP9_BIOPF|nr:hypothetical protein Bpfe_000286 [Biomphalaria pfeifferi]